MLEAKCDFCGAVISENDYCYIIQKVILTEVQLKDSDNYKQLACETCKDRLAPDN